MAFQIRPVSGYSELERFVATRNEVFPDDPETAEMLALVRASELDHVDVAAYEGEEMLGTGMLAGDPASLDSTHPFVEVTVPERHRRRGIGTALLRRLSEHARGLGKEGLECEARGHDEYSIAFLDRRGFVEQGRARKFVLDLHEADARDAPSPPGVELVMLSERPRLVERMYEVATITHPDLGGFQARHADNFLEWQVYQLGSPLLALEMTPVALSGEQVIGFATLIRGTDGRSAEHRMAVVLPEWRRQGVATAMLRAQIVAAKRASLETLVAWERSEHAGRTYGHKVGFQPRGETIRFRGPLL